MEVRENERKEFEGQVPYVPSTPLKPILEKPEPIWTPVVRKQLFAHSNGITACSEPAAGAETYNWAHHQSPPVALAHDNAKIRVPITFDDIPSSSNSIAGILTQANALLALSNASDDGFLDQFVPAYSQFNQFNPTDSLLSQHHHLPHEQSMVNPTHDKEQNIPAGTSYCDYYSNAFLQIAPPPDNVITAEARQDAVTQMTMGERDPEGGEKNVTTTECSNQQSKLYDPVTEVAVASTHEQNHNLGEEMIHEFNLNERPIHTKTPRRRKHRPKVVRESKPKTTKQVTTKPAQSKAKPTDMRKARKGLSTTTPSTDVAAECTGQLMSGSAKRPCKRQLFGESEQPDNSACRENATTNFERDISAVVEETQGLNNCVSLQDAQAPSTYTDIGSSWSWSTGSGLHVGGSKRKHSSIQQAHDSGINLVGAQYNALQAYCQNYNVHFPNVQKKRRSEKGRNTSYKITPTERAIHDKPQPFEYNLRLGQRAPTKRRSRVPTRIQDCALLTISRNCYAKPAHTAKQTCSPHRSTFGDAERPQACIDALAAEVGASLTKKKRTRKTGIPASSAYPGRNEMQQHHKVPSHNSLGVAFEETMKYIYTVDDLIEKFGCLDIYRETSELVSHGQNMLIPYKHNEDGTIIPYQAPSNPIKKQSPRPKVDLDEETNRVWKLLLLDINSNGIDGTDEAKAKWWEQERNVFRGRADSFIARMHLVQGDRRFSPWKGSVVDSVVGVFLTQNVSDHLSSSAFMSLAARFPLRSSKQYEAYHKESTNLIIKEPQVYIVEPEENVKLDEKISDQSVCELNSMTTNIIDLSEEREATDSNDSCRTTRSLSGLRDEGNGKLLESAQRHSREHSPAESRAISAVTGEGQETLCHGSISKELTEVFSSQYFADTSQISRDFSIYQNPEKIWPFLDRNSETEDLSNDAKYNIYNNKTSFVELLEMANSTMLHEVNSQRWVENSEKSNVTQSSFEASLTNEYTLKMAPNNGILEVNCYDPLKMEVTSSSSSKDKDEDDKRSNFPIESDNQAAIAHSKGQKKTKKKKKKKKIKNTFDWDNLRIQAQAKAGKREKTEDTMDSLDWDAVRCTDVNEIADIIRERGMNNMLAERIKDFLNLLVDKHGGAIDLEWLRDVPPDQAKEFLLSINGLGLKSVECVRLLTLHHLAFPVDTNVGRIAVRLGWVPLQPLPESLQLHLLELYPVLESIQKYLWPRLCKLDQRTLYELHYQLITFGKVFCTKSKPNCNACPMRAECRHFASAFASARLALPGPEQKSIVIATGNNATEQSPSVVINQLPLLLPENTNQAEFQQTELIRQLEAISKINTTQPIIEEPATPEPECSQVSEVDIEDFKKESCEIPTITLDMEDFTLKLQNYVQHDMELQEGEMSKALVALQPDVGHIPAPKLKNVGRLRTEHYVYELPDSHPLLEGWDKREPDDPGKYLLAIWTPGETADSIQPPGRKCSSQDCGQLCDDNQCFSCNNYREANSEIVRGTILIPCRTAMRGSFPLNGTYFQVNEVFADNDSSLNPIGVPRSLIWNLNRRTVYFGTSVTTIFRGLSTAEIQLCFWRGYVCVRGFDRNIRAPRPLLSRLHFSANKNKVPKNKVPKSKVPRSRGRPKKTSKSANSQGLNFNQNPQLPESSSNYHNLQQVQKSRGRPKKTSKSANLQGLNFNQNPQLPESSSNYHSLQQTDGA